MDNVNKQLSKHKKFRIDHKKLALISFVLAILIALVVFWWLKLVGITITGDAFCGMTEHVHSDDCYTDRLICDFVETETTTDTTADTTTTAHSTTEATETAETTETTESAETTVATEATESAHVHTDACYEKELVCEKHEHTHTQDCFPDETADVEKVSDWLATFEDVTITNNIPENLVAIARTQIGYTESKDNFAFDDNGNRQGYTRYGEWYGTTHSPWNTTFVSFCLHYSNVKNDDDLKHAGAEAMRQAWKSRFIYSPAEEYTPQTGDIVFFDDDENGLADRVAIVIAPGVTSLTAIIGDSNDAVEVIQIEIDDTILGYGRTGSLNYAKDMNDDPEIVEEPEEETPTPEEEPNIKRPLLMFSASPSSSGNNVISDLTDAVVEVTIYNHGGDEMAEGSQVHVGEYYKIEIEFSEDNTEENWLQFASGTLTYQLPDNLECEPSTEWHSITAKTPVGDIKDVGRYFVHENGLIEVEFYKTSSTDSFVNLYTNVDFTIEFEAIIVSDATKTETNIKFNEEIDFNLDVEVRADLKIEKTAGKYNPEDHTVDYTISVKVDHGVINDFELHDVIYYNSTHTPLRDTILVTEIDGTPLDPQPTIIDNTFDPYANPQAGFSLVGFPPLSSGRELLVTYKSQVKEEYLKNEEVGLWNDAAGVGKLPNGDTIGGNYIGAGTTIRPDQMKKEGKQITIREDDGTVVRLIQWDVDIIQNLTDLHDTLIIDTLQGGMEYYTGKPIYIRRQNKDGTQLSDVYLDWDQITVNGDVMSFQLPDGFHFFITYYTTYDDLLDGEERPFTNTITSHINGEDVEIENTTDVIGMDTLVEKSAYGSDGEYAYFTITANVDAILHNRGNFYISDYQEVWPYWGQTLYIENAPQDMEITATTESGDVVTFTPYVPGGPEENTYILVTPVLDTDSTKPKQYMFKIYFNTSETTNESSKWMLTEDAVLTVKYKIPFSAKTGFEWEGELTGYQTLGDILAEDYELINHTSVTYTEKVDGTADATYAYNPKIDKESHVNADGTINYTVTFTNMIPGTNPLQAYLDQDTQSSYFTDIFDEKLEYVPGSLMVTCYPTWNGDVWFNKYYYPGDIQGNEIRLPAEAFVYHSTHPSYMGWSLLTDCPNFEEYYSTPGIIIGGTYVFTYTLKIKDEYFYTTDYNLLEMDNTAEIIWDENGTSQPSTEHVQFPTGLLDKAMSRRDDKLDFSIYVNRRGLDVIEGSDTLTLTDVMTNNMSIYWDTIQLYYQDDNGDWVNFLSEGSPYTYTASFDQHNNALILHVPDELPIKLDYTTLVTADGWVQVHNTVSIDGKASVSDFADATFQIESHSGSASGSMNQITLIKDDGETKEPLSNVKFYLYGPKSDDQIVVPAGQPATITTELGKTLFYIGTYTTGEDGTTTMRNQYLTEGGPYALVEDAPPPGYIAQEKPTYFYFYKDDPNGIIQTVTTIIAVDNYRYGFVLPETGGTGALPLGIIGAVTMALPIVYSILRRKRERRSY